MYSFHSRVRYSEIDPSGYMSIPALVNYFQDCSTFQLETGGIGLDYLKERMQGWVISSWQIEMNRLPKISEEIVISTSAHKFKGFLGYRNYLMETVDGERLAVANSIWLLMDMVKGKPIPVPAEISEKIPVEEPLVMSDDSRKIQLPDNTEYTTFDKIRIGKDRIDTNHHVNNEQYIRMALEYVEQIENVRRMRVEYRKSAVLDDIIVPKVYNSDNKSWVVLESEDGVIFSVVEVVR